MIAIQRTFWVVVFLLVASVFGAAVWGSSIYYRLIYLWILLLVTSWLWTYLSLRNITVRRTSRSFRQAVGQIFEERFEVDNQSRLFRLWLAIHDQSSLPGSAGSRVITWIGGRQQRSYVSYTWLTRRGRFILGPTLVHSGDLFGLFRATREFKSTSSILVTPHMVEIQSFPAPSGLLPGGRALHRRTLEVTPYAAGVREYFPGDSLNRIHWPTTARRDRLMVKEFEQDPQADVWIFLDAQKFVQAALPEAAPILKSDRLWLWRHRPEEVKLPSATFEYAVSIAASISNYFLKQGQAVGLASAGQVFTALSPERGERQLGKILETLAFLEGEGDLPLVGLVTAQSVYLPRGSTVVIITPSTQSSVIAAIGDLEKRNMHPVVVLLDAASFGGAGGTSDLADNLAARNVLTMQVANHADIRAALEQTSVYSPVGWWSHTEEIAT
ncbi:MAG: DUF58 domain-containing protein [Chloroflexi bacterium]|nr:DUF58 domain-containing protein [Chloroflexota bacterium]